MKQKKTQLIAESSFIRNDIGSCIIQTEHSNGKTLILHIDQHWFKTETVTMADLNEVLTLHGE